MEEGLQNSKGKIPDKLSTKYRIKNIFRCKNSKILYLIMFLRKILKLCPIKIKREREIHEAQKTPNTRKTIGISGMMVKVDPRLSAVYQG